MGHNQDPSRQRESCLLKPTSKPADEALHYFLVANLALPDRLHMPVGCMQKTGFSFVSRTVGCDLGGSEVAIRLGLNAAVPTIVTVPEAAVHEDHGPVARKDDVRSSG